MRKILILLLLFPMIASAQDTKTPFATTSVTIPNRYAWSNNGLWVDSVIKFTKYRQVSDTALLAFDTSGKGYLITKTMIENWAAANGIEWPDTALTIPTKQFLINTLRGYTAWGDTTVTLATQSDLNIFYQAAYAYSFTSATGEVGYTRLSGAPGSFSIDGRYPLIDSTARVFYTPAEMLSYRGAAKIAILADTLLGGIFHLKSGSYTADSGSIWPAPNSKFWVRDFEGHAIQPKWYGAKADSSTDDWNALQKAIYASARFKTPVYIKAGNYQISQRLVTPTASNVQADQNAKISTTTFGMSAIYVGLNSHWDGGVIMLGTLGYAAFEVDGALRFTAGATHPQVTNVRIQGGFVKGQKGFWVHGSGTNNDVQSFRATGCKVTSCPNGLVMESTSGSKLYNNFFDLWIGGADTAVVMNNTTGTAGAGPSYNKIIVTHNPSVTTQVSGTKFLYCNTASNYFVFNNFNWLTVSALWADKKAVTFAAASENNTIDLRGSEAKYRHVNNLGANNQILSLSYNNVNILDYRDRSYIQGSNRCWDTAFNEAITDLVTSFGGGTIYVPKDTFKLRHQIKMKPNIQLVGENRYKSVLYNINNGLVQGSVLTFGLYQQSALLSGITEYRINTITPGRKVTMTTTAQAANVAVGSLWIIRAGYFPVPVNDSVVGSNETVWGTIMKVDSVDLVGGKIYFKDGFEDTITAPVGMVLQMTNLNNATFKGDSCYIIENASASNLTMMSDSSSAFVADACLRCQVIDVNIGRTIYGGGGNGKIRWTFSGIKSWYRNRAWESADVSGWNTIQNCEFNKTVGETRGAEKEVVLQIRDKVRNMTVNNYLTTESNGLRCRSWADVDGLTINGSFSSALLTFGGDNNIVRNTTIRNLGSTTRSIASGSIQDSDTSTTELSVYRNTVLNCTFIGPSDSLGSNYNIDVKGDYNTFMSNKFLNNSTNRKFNFNGVGDIFSNSYYDHPAGPVITELAAGRTAIGNIVYNGGYYPIFATYNSDSATLHDLPSTITDSITYTGFAGTATYTSAKHKAIKIGRHIWWEAVIVLSGSGATTTTAVTVPVPSWLNQPVSNGLTGSANEQFPCTADIFSNASGSTTLTTARVTNRPGTLASRSVVITKASGTVTNIWIKADWETAQ